MIEGLDVSVYQNSTPSLAGKDFLFARASIGTKPDAMFAEHIANAKKAGVVTGAYHFGVNASVDAQLATFLKLVEGKVDLVALDWESSTATMTKAQATSFIAGAKVAFPQKVLLYHSLSGFADLGQEGNWVAYWNKTPPTIPWHFWQNGPDHGVDHNYFNGTREQLNAFAGVSMAKFVQSNGYNVDSAKVLHVAKGSAWKYLDDTPGGTFSADADISVLGLLDAHGKQYVVEITTGVPYADKQPRNTLVQVESDGVIVTVPPKPVDDLPTRQAQWDKDAANAIGPRPTT